MPCGLLIISPAAMLRQSCFLRHFILQTRTNVYTQLMSANFFTNSPGRQSESDTSEPEDFFGIPAEFKLQQKRIKKLNSEDVVPPSRSRSRSTYSRISRSRPDASITHSQTHPSHVADSTGNFQAKLLSKKERFEDVKCQSVESVPDRNIFDEQYFEGLKEFRPPVSDDHHDKLNNPSLFDVQYFEGHESRLIDESKLSQDSEKTLSFKEVDPNFTEKSGNNLFDEQYFQGALNKDLQECSSRTNHGDNSCSLSSHIAPMDLHFQHDSQLNYIEEQYFGSNESQIGSDIQSLNDVYTLSDKSRDSMDASLDSDKMKSSNGQESLAILNPVQSKGQHQRRKIEPVASNQNIKNKQTISTKHQLSLKEPVTAYDVAVNVRRELQGSKSSSVVLNAPDKYISGDLSSESNVGVAGEDEVAAGKKRDSKGFRILSDQLLDINKMTTSDILLMLRKKIIFDHEDFLAINKPYGLPSFGNNNDRLSLESLLPRLCKTLPPNYKVSDLHLVQGLDRDVSGAVILAKNEASAQLLKGMFDANEIVQRFWAITKGVPNLKAGLVDIPIGEAKVGGIYKMVLRPAYSNEPKFRKKTSRSQSYEAMTEFKVLASHQEAALVECQPKKKLVRHQLRVHLSNGLNTPILGDHKYSHFSKLAPQKLNHSTLDLLNIRQAKVRHLALHLHCHTIVIPYYKSKMIFIPTKLPPHFYINMKSLKLSLKK